MLAIINRQSKHPIRAGAFRLLLACLARRYHLAGAEVSLVFVGKTAARSLNRRYRKKDRPTDVLSFPLQTAAEDGCFYLGDIVICVPVADRQARRAGRGLERELKMLALHGYLHLLGFDHGAGLEEEERAAAAACLGR